MKRCVSNLETNYFIINMSSSRSIAAARNRRSGDAPVNIPSQQRPGTSISSQSAFSQQNTRPSNQNQKSQNQNQNQKQKSQDVGKPPNGLPFSKLSVSDAIGLVTLRLGRVEQFMIDIHEQGGISNASVPDNKLVIDNSVITNIVSRLDSLEKKEHSSTNNEKLAYLENEVVVLKNAILKLTTDMNLFIQNTSDKFIDYEEAFIELEKTILTNDPLLNVEQIQEAELDETNNINMIIQEGYDEVIEESETIS
jgi:hypothetical protein